MDAPHATELERIRAAYAKRMRTYDPTDPWVCAVRQERERALVRWVRRSGIAPLEERRLVELGCGEGGNLLDFLRLGFRPENLVGNDLLAERIAAASRQLPASVTLSAGDATSVALPDGTFDVVFQSMMCSSILDERLLEAVARRMWALARPGGGLLWYDFIYDNPSNPDVRGIPLQRIRTLFPLARMTFWRVTLAPPLGRPAARVHRSVYSLLNLLPWLRTHVLCWLVKPPAARTIGPHPGSGAEA